jgi:hypothetical protein
MNAKSRIAGMSLLAAMLASPLACDQISGKPKAGETCSTQDQADCKDDKTIITCDQGKYIEYPCKGPTGCKKEGVLVKCDESLGDVGDACSHNGNYTCASDGSAQLVCTERAWVLSSHCRGPKKCVPEGLYVKCDQTVAKVGDSCEEKAAACSDDSKAVLECADKKYAVKQKCDTSCEIKDKLVQCKAKADDEKK